MYVNVGHIDQIPGFAGHYEVLLKKSVPGLAVLDANGKLLYSQKTCEFESIRETESGCDDEFSKAMTA